MPITINGTGSITGLTAGGLPDGSVTAADIESSLDLTGKTVTLPSGTGGKILQVVQTVKTDTTSTTSTSFTDISGLSVSITPSSTSSKILVIPDLALSNNSIMYARLLRDSTVIYAGSSGTHNVLWGGYAGDPGGGVFDYGLMIVNRTILDSPATTSAVTYKCQYKTYSNSIFLNSTRHLNNAYDIHTQSSITVMEVAA